MKFLEFLFTKACEEANEIGKAFTKTLTFGIDSVDPKSGLSCRQKIVEETNDYLVFLRILNEEGIDLPGIGDPAYLEKRTEKAIAGAAEAHRRGIIEGLTVSVEDGEAEGQATDPVAAFLAALAPTTDAGGEALARRFHDLYEKLAPSFGYETREDTRTFDPSTPNGKLMIAVCTALIQGEPEASSEPVAAAA